MSGHYSVNLFLLRKYFILFWYFLGLISCNKFVFSVWKILMEMEKRIFYHVGTTIGFHVQNDFCWLGVKFALHFFSRFIFPVWWNVSLNFTDNYFSLLLFQGLSNLGNTCFFNAVMQVSFPGTIQRFCHNFVSIHVKNVKKVSLF